MAIHSRIRSGMTLEQFLLWPRIDEKPYLEFYDGRIEERMTGAVSHSVLMSELTSTLDFYAKSSRLGMAFHALRCTFGSRSIVGDVIFLLDAKIRCDERGLLEDETNVCPDIQVEIRSPEESSEKVHAKLSGSIADGCSLGWFLDPFQETIDVFRPDFPIERLPADGFLDASPVLPEFRIAVSEIFGRLNYRDCGKVGPRKSRSDFTRANPSTSCPISSPTEVGPTGNPDRPIAFQNRYDTAPIQDDLGADPR